MSLTLYLAFPFMQISWTPEVLSGVGMRTSIFWANSEGLKLDLMTTLTSNLVRPTSLTRGITRNGREMSLVVRYLEQIQILKTCQKQSWFFFKFLFNISYQKLSKDKKIIIKFWFAISGKYDFLWNISPVVDQFSLTTYFLKMYPIFVGSPDHFGRRYERKKIFILDQLIKENYLMSSYSPPGGIKEIACSVSNFKFQLDKHWFDEKNQAHKIDFRCAIKLTFWRSQNTSDFSRQNTASFKRWR